MDDGKGVLKNWNETKFVKSYKAQYIVEGIIAYVESTRQKNKKNIIFEKIQFEWTIKPPVDSNE